MQASIISVNKNIQGGTPCFAGTRVPVSSLFDHLEGGYTIDYFVNQFPSVRREQVIASLVTARKRTELEAAAGTGFEVVITKDSGVEHERHLAALPLAVFVIKTKTNKIDDILPLLPLILS